jgi:hypothetical protein
MASTAFFLPASSLPVILSPLHVRTRSYAGLRHTHKAADSDFTLTTSYLICYDSLLLSYSSESDRNTMPLENLAIRPTTPLENIVPTSHEYTNIQHDRDFAEKFGNLPDPTFSTFYSDRAGMPTESQEQYAITHQNISVPSHSFQQDLYTSQAETGASHRSEAPSASDTPRPGSPDLRHQDLQTLRARGIKMLQEPGEGKVHDINWNQRSLFQFALQKELSHGNLSLVLRGKSLEHNGWTLPKNVEPYPTMTQKEKARAGYNGRQVKRGQN